MILEESSMSELKQNYYGSLCTEMYEILQDVYKRQVQEGETLWDISKLYGISISELARRNPNVKRPDQLAAGEKVALR